MKIHKTFKHLELIEISENRYCVRRTYKNWLRQTKQDYYCLNFNGTEFTATTLSTGVTVTDDYERCLHIFNCNAIKAGAI